MRKSFETRPALFVSSTVPDHPSLHVPDDTEAVLDWTEPEALMDETYASKTGCPSYPLLTLLRSLLPGMWYKLSDRQPACSVARELLFRRFCRLELSSHIPDATTPGRFRQQPVEHDLWEKLPGGLNRQLEEKHIIITEGRINTVDATPVEAAQRGPGTGVDGKRAGT